MGVKDKVYEAMARLESRFMNEQGKMQAVRGSRNMHGQLIEFEEHVTNLHQAVSKYLAEEQGR